MELASVRALKEEISIGLVAPIVERQIATRKFGLPASSIARAASPQRAMALGIAASADGYSLAVRTQRRTLEENDSFLAEIERRARGEVDIRYVGQLFKQAPPWHQCRQRPLKTGVSIAHCNVTAGTLGAFVKRSDDGKMYLLSNNHVLANEDAGSIGDAVLQQGPYDGGVNTGDRVGALAQWIAFNPANNLVDAAIAELDDGADVVLRDLCGLGTLNGLADQPLLPGTPVSKIGRTTGLTRGVVTAIEIDDVVVSYDCGNISFDRQIEIEGMGDNAFSAGGDSGSLIVDDDMRAVGLLFAGGDHGASNGKGLTYANDIGAVLSALQIELAIWKFLAFATRKDYIIAMTITLEQAREAKSQALVMSRQASWPATGVGVGQVFGGLAVKVNLSSKPRKRLPETINGVPVVYEITGKIRKRPL